MIHLLPAALLALVLFLVLLPVVGFLHALLGIAACIAAALVGGGPFLLYAIWRDRR